MIQEFLTNNLIQITEDENVEKLSKASAALEKKLSKNKNRIQTFTLIALDPEIKVTDPNVQEVQQLIINKWKTFTVNCNDTPLTYIRAVILETLEKLSKDINLANIVFLSSRNIMKQLNLKGKEKDLLTEFLLDIGTTIERTASLNWSLSSNNDSNLTIQNLEKLADTKLDTTTLQKKLEDASGPHNSESITNYDSPNPHWPNTGASWSYQFPSRASNGISLVVNSALKKQTEGVNVLINDVNKTLADITDKLFEAQKMQNILLDLRTELLWWKEACYSKTLCDSYRSTQNGVLQLILALDYSTFIPFVYPQSVDFFLIETHKGIIAEEDKKLTLIEIFKLIDSSKETLYKYLGEESFEIERTSLIHFVKGYISEKYSIKQLKDIVGISENSELTLSEFTLWMFHDFQVLKSF